MMNARLSKCNKRLDAFLKTTDLMQFKQISSLENRTSHGESNVVLREESASDYHLWLDLHQVKSSNLLQKGKLQVVNTAKHALSR